MDNYNFLRHNVVCCESPCRSSEDKDSNTYKPSLPLVICQLAQCRRKQQRLRVSLDPLNRVDGPMKAPLNSIHRNLL